MYEGIEINGLEIDSSVYQHLGNERISPKLVIQDIISANVFDMMTDRERIEEWISYMKFFETIEEYNEKTGEDVTYEEMFEDYFNVISSGCTGGFVLI